MKKMMSIMKVALVAGALSGTGTGCCLFGDKCCEETCTKKECCAKKSGANTSMTISAGTSGVSVGGEANLGSHGASSEMKAY